MQRSLTLTCGTVVLAGLLSGCGAGLLLEVKEEEINRLTAQTREQEQALKSKDLEIAQLKRSYNELYQKTEGSGSDTARLEEEARRYKQKLAEVSKEKVKVEGRLLETERSYEQLKQTLKDVQAVAAKTAEEYADLRLRIQEYDRRSEGLKKANATLREENRRFSRELDSLKESLKREQAVVRSMSTSGQSDLRSELQERVRQLEDQNEDLRSEKVTLLKQLDRVKSHLPEGEVAVGEDTLIYQEDPRGLWKEVAGLVGSRYRRMVNGKAAWDTTDYTLVAGTAVGVFLLFWILLTPRRWRNRRILEAEVARLRARLRDGGRDGGRDSVRRKRTPRETGIVRRSGQFSPIISGDQHYEEEGAGILPEEEAYDVGGDSEPELAPPPGSAPAAPPRPERDPLQSSSERAAPPQPAAEDEEDEFGNTKIISSLDELDAVGDETEQTVYLGDSPAGEKGKRKESKSGGSNKELMDELEDLIGKKVDELIL